MFYEIHLESSLLLIQTPFKQMKSSAQSSDFKHAIKSIDDINLLVLLSI